MLKELESELLDKPEEVFLLSLGFSKEEIDDAKVSVAADSGNDALLNSMSEIAIKQMIVLKNIKEHHPELGRFDSMEKKLEKFFDFMFTRSRVIEE